MPSSQVYYNNTLRQPLLLLSLLIFSQSQAGPTAEAHRPQAAIFYEVTYLTDDLLRRRIHSITTSHVVSSHLTSYIRLWRVFLIAVLDLVIPRPALAVYRQPSSDFLLAQALALRAPTSSGTCSVVRCTYLHTASVYRSGEENLRTYWSLKTRETVVEAVKNLASICSQRPCDISLKPQDS